MGVWDPLAINGGAAQRITAFWKEISDFISFITKTNYLLIPETALFGTGLDKWPNKFHVFITHVLIAARRTLASD